MVGSLQFRFFVAFLHIITLCVLPYPQPSLRDPGDSQEPKGEDFTMLLVEVFPLIPLFPVFFDSAGGRIERKNLFVKVRPFEKRNMRV